MRPVTIARCTVDSSFIVLQPGNVFHNSATPRVA
jgi:hypothetical protein